MVSHEGDKLLISASISGTQSKKSGVVVVVGRRLLWGNQWFFAKADSLTAAQLERIERYEYSSPVASEVYHDYSIYTSSLAFSDDVASFTPSWPPDLSSGEETNRYVDKVPDVALQIMYRTMMVKMSKISYKYPPFGDFARVFGPIGGLIGVLKAISEYRKKRAKQKRKRVYSDATSDMTPPPSPLV